MDEHVPKVLEWDTMLLSLASLAAFAALRCSAGEVTVLPRNLIEVDAHERGERPSAQHLVLRGRQLENVVGELRRAGAEHREDDIAIGFKIFIGAATLLQRSEELLQVGARPP